MFLISSAFADTAATAASTAAAPAGAPGIFVTILPLLLVFVVFYVMVIRPQNKRVVEHRNTVNNLKKGDKVVTGGGIVAKVKKMSGEDEVVLEIADGVEVTVLRHTIISVR